MRSTRIKLILASAVLAVLSTIVVVVGGLLYWEFGRNRPNVSVEPERVFAGSSDQLKRTVILPSLDSPFNEDQSAIWCISIQLAWNQLRDDLVQEDVKLRNGQMVAERLNRASRTKANVATKDFLAMAGTMKDGIENRIESALAAKFPGNSMPPVQGSRDGVVVFGYLKADVRYRYQFRNSPEWLSFKGSEGRTVPVRGFGLVEFPASDPLVGPSRDQVRVLFRDGGRFAVDLSHESKHNQIYLAKMPRKATLAETLTDLNEKLANSPSVNLPETATLLVPNVNWRIEHRFRELEGEDKEFLNAALPNHYLANVTQFVDFKMDRFGSSVESGSYLASSLLNGHEHDEDVDPDHYHFDRPFLIVMKKRGAEHPFFVMWVDNAELLCKR